MSLKVLVTGVLAIDEIRNEFTLRTELMGGSVPFAAMAAASYTDEVGVYGVVGEDYPIHFEEIMRSWGIDMSGLERICGGKTFRWGGEYAPGMDERATFMRELNVLEGWVPCMGGRTQSVGVLVLASATGRIHLDLLNEYGDGGIVVADTMDFWIEKEREETDEVVRRSDIFTLNESEAILYSGTDDLDVSAQFLMNLGARFLVIKRGSRGALIYGKSDEHITCSVEPCSTENSLAGIKKAERGVCSLKGGKVVDPTGAGDSFLGGIAGYLASKEISKADLNFDDVVLAVEYGTVTASFVCEGFGVEALVKAGKNGVCERLRLFREGKA